jgi:glycosyltransferase involved in cell wall biosynthesis
MPYLRQADRKIDMPVGREPSSAVTDAAIPRDDATVAVIIPTFNQSRFLADAITSVFAQTREADEIIVVDDGSNDDPATVVAQSPKVRLIRQDNRGNGAARNTGLRNCTASYVVFLDADDRLLPRALEAGLACITNRPDCAFVYGGYRLISEEGQPIGLTYANQIDGDAYLALLRSGGAAAGIMTMFHRRDCLLAVDGFDETLRAAEDLDLKLRITKRYQITCHSEIVAEYRRHGQNMSNNHAYMLENALLVLNRHDGGVATDSVTRAALREGRAHRRRYFVSQMLAAAAARWHVHNDVGILVGDLAQAARWSPFLTMRMLLGALGRRTSKVLPHRSSIGDCTGGQ